MQSYWIGLALGIFFGLMIAVSYGWNPRGHLEQEINRDTMTQIDPAFLQKVLRQMQSQRNQALDAHAMSEANAARLTEELAKANERIKELETKLKDPKK